MNYLLRKVKQKVLFQVKELNILNYRYGIKCVIAKPIKGGQIYIHEDCWGNGLTCRGTRGGGIYDGVYSIENWYNKYSIYKSLKIY